MSIETKLKTSIETSVKELFDIEVEPGLVMLEIPNNPSQGDYSTNIAMRLTKRVGKNPRDIASALVESLKDIEIISNVEMAGPGFINFFMKSDVMGSVVKTVLEEDTNYGRVHQEHPKNIMVEYVSANPTGRLHVGHARGAAWGDSLTRILDFAGYHVLREYYVNDLGQQIENLAHSLYARYLENFNIEKEIPEDGYQGQDIKDIAKELVDEIGDKYTQASEEEWLPYFKEEGIRFELDRIRDDLSKFGVTFDTWSSEKNINDQGKVEISLQELQDKGVTYESEGALWFKSTDFGDDKDRVLIKSDGSYTYFVPDIAYHIDKAQRTQGSLVDLLGGDHHGYIARMKAALEALGYKDILDVDIIQMVRIVENGEEVKMSKRTGNAIGLIELVDEIGKDATRYFFASRALNTQLDFDLTLAKSQSSENPVYYAQYAHARISTILENAKELYQDVGTYDLLTEAKEIELLKLINDFKNVVEDAAKTRLVNKVTNYIHELASSFHSYYGEVKIVDRDNEELTNQRLHLLKATQITLRNALNLIGVSAPEKM